MKYKMRYTKEQLIEIAKEQGFFNKSVNKMFATTDGNFFHEDAFHFASSHKTSDKELEIVEITRNDLSKNTQSEEVKKEDKKEEKELMEVAKELYKEKFGKNPHPAMKLETIQSKIDG